MSNLIGAALMVEDLETYADWIIRDQRDLEIQSFFFPEVLNGDWSPIADRVNTLLEGYEGRLGIHGPFWGFSLATHDPEIRDVVTKRFQQALDVCEKINATQMVVHSPYTNWDHNNLDRTRGERANLIKRVHDTLKPVVRRAEDQGVTLVIENIEDVDPHDRRVLAESFASDAVRLSIDTGHAHYSHHHHGAPPVDYFIHSAGDMLEHIHLQDVDGHADRHWAIGEGKIGWPSVFRAIAALPTSPRIVLELHNAADIPASMDFLKDRGLGH